MQACKPTYGYAEDPMISFQWSAGFEEIPVHQSNAKCSDDIAPPLPT